MLFPALTILRPFSAPDALKEDYLGRDLRPGSQRILSIITVSALGGGAAGGAGGGGGGGGVSFDDDDVGVAFRRGGGGERERPSVRR